MTEVPRIEERLLDQQTELLEQLQADPDDACVGGPLIAGLGDVLIASTNVLRENLAACIDKLAVATAEIERLKKHLGEVEGRGLKYKGVYQKAQRYKRGDVVTYSGSGYVAIKDVVPEGEVPNASTYWSILVQRGRDAAGRDR